MSNNASVFKKYIKEKNYIFNEWSDDEYDYFEKEENIKDGSRIRVIISFDKKEMLASIYIVDFVSITNPSKRDYSLQLINELNQHYIYQKFAMDKEGNVVIQCNLPIKDNFDPEIAAILIFFALKSADEEYSKFMKIQWS